MNKLILIFLLLTSCAMLNAQNKTEFKAFSWEKASIDSVKKSVLADYENMADDSWIRMRPELNIPKSESPKLICHAFPYYTIDSLSMVQMNEKTDISSVLKLDKNYMYCLYSMGNEFLFAALMRRENGTWKHHLYGLIDKNLSLIYNDHINNQKKQIIYVVLEKMYLDYSLHFEDGDFWIVTKDRLNFKNHILKRLSHKNMLI